MDPDRPSPGHWWFSNVRREADRDRLGLGERAGNVIGLFITVIVALVLLDVQATDQGFFTPAFGPVEQVAFYGSLLFGAVPMIVRAVVGWRNLGRLMDTVNSVAFITAWSYLLTTFPFDFPRLWDYLPDVMGAALSWIGNDLVRFVIALAMVVTAISAAYNIIMFFAVRRELRSRGLGAT